MNGQLSYSMLTTLYCPVKYYLYYKQNIKIFSHHLIIGTMIHDIYEKQLQLIIDDKKSSVNFDFINDNYLNTLFDNTIEQYKNDEFFLPILLEKRNDIINDIPQYLYPSLINSILNLLNHNYQLTIEKEIILPEYINFLNKKFNLYSRFDFLLENDKTIKIFDIKTKNFNKSYTTQLMLYLYNYITYNPDIKYKKIFGYNYLAFYNLIKPTVILSPDNIINYVDLLFDKLNKLYQSLGITSLDNIEEWILNINNKTDIYNLLIDNYFSTCQFCPYSSICFLKNNNDTTIVDLIKGKISANDIKKELYLKNTNKDIILC